MTPERYRQVKDVFNFAAGLPPAKQASFLASYSMSDPTLFQRVLELLNADALPTAILDKPAVSPDFSLRTKALAKTAGQYAILASRKLRDARTLQSG